MITIRGEDALAQFRASLTGRRGLDLVTQNGGGVLVQLPVGVGKSRWLDDVTVEAVEDGDYGLVVVLCPTRRLIRERRPLREPPPGVKVIDLRPRPAERCGPERDAQWRRFEANDLAALGRLTLCQRCPHLKGCFWPDQYGKSLEGARLIYATQAHLARSPGFLVTLRVRAKAERVLTLFDESNFVASPGESTIRARDLERFCGVLEAADVRPVEPEWDHGRWRDMTEMLRGASTEDLQDGRWRFPYVHSEWAAAVQQVGFQRHGDDFRFLGFALNHLGFSPIETRRRDEAGDVQFANRPYVGDCIVFSATTNPDFARHRLGRELASPFADHRFAHPQTRWYNLASRIGSRRYFPRHAAQILDFIAGLTARRASEGKRVLLVVKKCFASLCGAELAERFARMGADLVVVTSGWTAGSLADPRAVPLITYGMIGTNLFEHFDAALCVSGYYVNEGVVDRCLQDLTRRDLRLPIRIETGGDPKRRRAGVIDPDHRYYDVARLAQPALEFNEHAVVVQAVGRVRPFTRPREVLSFQMAELPEVVYDAEFRTLNEARRHFGILSGREGRRADRAAQAASLRQAGLTQAETARIVGVTERTIRNYETQEDRKKPML